MDLNLEKCKKCKQHSEDDLIDEVKREDLYEDENGQKVSMKDASEQE